MCAIKLLMIVQPLPQRIKNRSKLTELTAAFALLPVSDARVDNETALTLEDAEFGIRPL